MAETLLAVDGKARCAVELATEPSSVEQIVGEELVHYPGMRGGAKVDLLRGARSDAPARILVGSRSRVMGSSTSKGEGA